MTYHITANTSERIRAIRIDLASGEMGDGRFEVGGWRLEEVRWLEAEVGWLKVSCLGDQKFRHGLTR